MATDDRKLYQKTLMDFIGCRPVAYWPALARRVGGVKAAVMLSQLLYWNGDKTVQERGWILKSVEDLETETGLNKLEQQTARRILQNSGILVCKLHGVPRIWHYQVDTDRLSDILVGTVSHPMGKPSNGKATQRSAEKPPNVERETDPTLEVKPSQLNKESENTSLRLHTEITSSSSSKAVSNASKEEEGPGEFSPEVVAALREIGVYQSLLDEVMDSQFTDDQLLILIKQAHEVDPAPGKTAAVFMYKLRNTSPESVKTEADRDAENRHAYVTGEYSDVIIH